MGLFTSQSTDPGGSQDRAEALGPPSDEHAALGPRSCAAGPPPCSAREQASPPAAGKVGAHGSHGSEKLLLLRPDRREAALSGALGLPSTADRGRRRCDPRGDTTALVSPTAWSPPAEMPRLRTPGPCAHARAKN